MSNARTACKLPQRKLGALRLAEDFECRVHDGPLEVTVMVGALPGSDVGFAHSFSKWWPKWSLSTSSRIRDNHSC